MSLLWSAIRQCRWLLLVLLAVRATQSFAEERNQLPGHVRVPASLHSIGRLPAETNLDLALGLPLRNKAALTNLLEQLYDP
ncbi:MAG TPA: hypothetical protein VKY92_05895, partial [Verrucomicrobiae bacterium]|nr:hypothetical protein [Verrucomicrobiae bacterium]